DEIDVATAAVVDTTQTETSLGRNRPWAIDNTGTTLAVMAPSAVLELFDLTSRTPIGTLPSIDQSADPQEAGSQTWVGFLPGRNALAPAGAGGTIAVGRLPGEVWLRIACAPAGRDLTASEWRTYTDAAVPPDLTCTRA